MRQIENILIPGRHHVLTNFHYEYLTELLSQPTLTDLNGQEFQLKKPPNIIWAVTSANHGNTRRNPISGSRREQAIESFSSMFAAAGFSYPINDIGSTPKFAHFVINEIEVQSRGQFRLTPENTVVICSTPSVITMYEKLGLMILPAEMAQREPLRYGQKPPWELILAIVNAGAGWRNDPTYLAEVHEISRSLLEKYRLGDLIIELHNDPLLGDEGDITDTRDYEKYRQAFEEGAIRKYHIVKPYLKSGRIVDIGCATGEIVKLMSEDPNLAESDLYGIEASRKLYEICERRRQDGDFSNENVFFYQRNIMTSVIFPDNSIDATTTFSLTHEIESYLGRDALLEFLQRVYRQTASGGVYINSDVVAPDNKDEQIILKLSDQDGLTESWEEIEAQPKVSKETLDGLSTLGRFKRFSRDFRTTENESLAFRETTEYGPDHFELKLGDACEFLSKKDYTDSWYSEMHERFCFWDFAEWQKAIQAAGFELDPQSSAYRNDWVIKNRYQPKAKLFKHINGQLKQIEFPVTNMLLIAEKKSWKI